AGAGRAGGAGAGGDGVVRRGARAVRAGRHPGAGAAPGPPRELGAGAVGRDRRGGRQPRGAQPAGTFRAAVAAPDRAARHAHGRRHAAARGPALHERVRADLGRTCDTMNRKGDKALIVGLDIGTSKVVALVGEYSPGNPIEVIGIGSHESRGLKRGVVVDIESTVQSIQRAVEEAELMAGCEISSVYASISGNHVQCRNSPGIVPIRDGEVTW